MSAVVVADVYHKAVAPVAFGMDFVHEAAQMRLDHRFYVDVAVVALGMDIVAHGAYFCLANRLAHLGVRHSVKFDFSARALALEGDPDSVVALEGLLGARLSLGDLEGAAPLFARLEKAGVPASRLVRARMNFFVQSGDFDAAEKAVSDVLAGAPREPDLLLDLFSVLSLRFASAEEPARSALRRRMEEIAGSLRLDPSVRAFQGAVAGAVLHLFDGKFSEARDEFRIADAARPGVPGIVNQILRLDYARQDRPRAEVHARRLLELALDPGLHEVLDTLGLALLAQSRPSEARETLGKAAKLAAESVEKGLSPPASDRPIRLHYARALFDAGSVAEARETLAALDASGPSFAGRDAAFRSELLAALSSAAR